MSYSAACQRHSLSSLSTNTMPASFTTTPTLMSAQLFDMSPSLAPLASVAVTFTPCTLIVNSPMMTSGVSTTLSNASGVIETMASTSAVGFGGWLRVQRGADAQRQSRRNCSSGAEGCLVVREVLGPLAAQDKLCKNRGNTSARCRCTEGIVWCLGSMP